MLAKHINRELSHDWDSLHFPLWFGRNLRYGGNSLLQSGSVIAYTASNLEKVHKLIKTLTGSASIFFGIVIILYTLV